ncbi:unnamed protein product [Brachionus calyciflorus]|uniref:FLYWCH-type domain-containing protein n=1 Tax=Brachionus calyciflorus TaxID=104777 RepID=A0A814M2F7_9BILA|nr:unnamed protein product [Brachionus calyciflorus]
MSETFDVENLASSLNSINLSLFGKITQSQKGFPKLYFQNYYYRLISANVPKYTWRCVKNYCNVRCSTNGNKIGDEYVVNFESQSTEHNHPSDPIKFVQLERRSKIELKASMCDEPPRKIISEFVNEITDEEEIANSASHNADRLFISRKKKESKPEYLKNMKGLKLLEDGDFLPMALST